MLDLIAIWTLSTWGLRQTPGLAAEISRTEHIETAIPLYEKSGLSAEHIKKIAKKIETAMKQDHLYRNPDLSLSLLAKHIAARPNYVSQTLSTKLNANFFDYINKWRIEDAKDRLEHSSENVLTIAFDTGFNSRSSFYTAFKRHTSTTPISWRKKLKDKPIKT